MNPLPSTRLAVLWTNAILAISGIAFILLQIYTYTSVKALKRAGLPYKKYLAPWIVGFWPIVGAILLALTVQSPLTQPTGSTTPVVQPTVVQPKPSPVTMPAVDMVPTTINLDDKPRQAISQILTGLSDVLSRAYQSHNTAWLQYYYSDPTPLVSGRSAAWQAGRIPTYQGAGNVSFDPHSFWVGLLLPTKIIVRYNLTIDGVTYTTTQTLVPGTAPGVSQPIWRVSQEVAPFAGT